MSKIEVNEIVNQSGDNDSGIDLTTNDQIGFKIANASKWTLNSSGNLFPASTSQGIVLGATSDTAANRLEDYEEGTWTPAIAGASNTPTFYNQVGRYTKIGRLVTIQCFLQTNVSPTYSNTATQFKISGVPFNLLAIGYTGAQGTVNSQALGYVSGDNDQNAGAGTGGGHLTCGMHADEQLIFHVTGSGQSRGVVENSGTTSGFILEATLTYFTDA